VVINVLSLSFLPGIGFGLAATALVGQAVGARRPDDAITITRIALRWATIWMGALGLVFLLLAPQLMRIFTNDQQMIDIGAAAIWVVALAQPFWAATFVYAGALRGTGNTRTPLLITGVVIVCPARSSPSTMPPVLSLAGWNAPAWQRYRICCSSR